MVLGTRCEGGGGYGTFLRRELEGESALSRLAVFALYVSA